MAVGVNASEGVGCHQDAPSVWFFEYGAEGILGIFGDQLFVSRVSWSFVGGFDYDVETAGVEGVPEEVVATLRSQTTSTGGSENHLVTKTYLSRLR